MIIRSVRDAMGESRLSARGQDTSFDVRQSARAEMSRRARTPALGSVIGRWLAAYLVVLQAVLGGLAAGAMAAPAAADAFTLCLSAASSGDAGADHGGSTPASVFHDCNACPLAGGVPLLPDVPTAQPFQALALTIAAPARWAAIWAPVPLSESARPRAPPRLG